jgi:hypothetical protein
VAAGDLVQTIVVTQLGTSVITGAPIFTDTAGSQLTALLRICFLESALVKGKPLAFEMMDIFDIWSLVNTINKSRCPS